MTATLFEFETMEESTTFVRDAELSQWFTPEWAAAALVERYFPALCGADLVIEPSCGMGAFLKAIPDHVPAIGVEIDPVLAQLARDNTGRDVITGDFTSVALPEGTTAIIGNPPYELSLFERFLTRAHRALPELAKCGFLVPCYFTQTWSRVNLWSARWSLRVDLVPRGLFPGIKFPLSFCVFSKDARRDMIGFALYAEAEQIGSLSKEAQSLLRDGRPRRSIWRALVEETLQQLGGKASLQEMYDQIEPRRPTENAFWREKVRQTLHRHFHSIGGGVWSLAA